jgi:hypothetical protein
MKLRATLVGLTVASNRASNCDARSSDNVREDGKNGRIAFRRFLTAGQAWEALFTINPDGTGERQITHPHRKVLDYDPDVSPDGRWLVYAKKWALRGDRGPSRCPLPGPVEWDAPAGPHGSHLYAREKDCERISRRAGHRMVGASLFPRLPL